MDTSNGVLGDDFLKMFVHALICHNIATKSNGMIQGLKDRGLGSSAPARHYGVAYETAIEV